MNWNKPFINGWPTGTTNPGPLSGEPQPMSSSTRSVAAARLLQKIRADRRLEWALLNHYWRSGTPHHRPRQAHPQNSGIDVWEKRIRSWRNRVNAPQQSGTHRQNRKGRYSQCRHGEPALGPQEDRGRDGDHDVSRHETKGRQRAEQPIDFEDAD